MAKRIVALVTLLVVAACGGGAETADTSPAEPVSSTLDADTAPTEPVPTTLGVDTTPTAPHAAGSDVDVCSLLAVEELGRLGVEVEQPTGEDDLPFDQVQQCTFWMAGSVMVTPTMSFDDYYSEADGTDLFDVVPLSGPGEWAGMAVDPDTGLVFSVAAGGRRGVVAITPWVEISPDTPDAEVLEELLGLAVSRLDS